MTLGEQQRLFTKLVGQLIGYAYDNDFELTFGDAFRTPEQAKTNAAAGSGIASSLHTQRLAIDLNAFKGGVYQSLTEQYAMLGEYWKTLHPLCRWGGDFHARPDGNHFSMTWGGVS
jgi:hypothetical protein